MVCLCVPDLLLRILIALSVLSVQLVARMSLGILDILSFDMCIIWTQGRCCRFSSSIGASCCCSSEFTSFSSSNDFTCCCSSANTRLIKQ